jgi:hypothetical protein
LRSEQMAQAVLDEDTVIGLFGIGKKGGEGKNSHVDAKYCACNPTIDSRTGNIMAF